MHLTGKTCEVHRKGCYQIESFKRLQVIRSVSFSGDTGLVVDARAEAAKYYDRNPQMSEELNSILLCLLVFLLKNGKTKAAISKISRLFQPTQKAARLISS